MANCSSFPVVSTKNLSTLQLFRISQNSPCFIKRIYCSLKRKNTSISWRILLGTRFYPYSCRVHTYSTPFKRPIRFSIPAPLPLLLFLTLLLHMLFVSLWMKPRRRAWYGASLPLWRRSSRYIDTTQNILAQQKPRLFSNYYCCFLFNI